MSDLGQMLSGTAGGLARDHAHNPQVLCETWGAAGLTTPFSATQGEACWADLTGTLAVLGRLAPISALADAMAADYVQNLYKMGAVGALSLSGQSLSLGPDGGASGRVLITPPIKGQTQVLACANGPDGNSLVLLDHAQASLRKKQALVGEGRIELSFQNVRPRQRVLLRADMPNPCLTYGALVRAAMSVGALERIFAMTRTHCQTREQFGRPLMRLQAVQMMVAQIASQMAAARAAVALLARRYGGADPHLLVAIAKLRTSTAAQKASALAHQCHGAIGYTEEYALQEFTRSLAMWRREFGPERHWAAAIGHCLAPDLRHIGLWAQAVDLAAERGECP